MKVQLFVPCFVDQLYPLTAFNMVKVLEKDVVRYIIIPIKPAAVSLHLTRDFGMNPKKCAANS